LYGELGPKNPFYRVKDTTTEKGLRSQPFRHFLEFVGWSGTGCLQQQIKSPTENCKETKVRTNFMAIGETPAYEVPKRSGKKKYGKGRGVQKNT